MRRLLAVGAVVAALALVVGAVAYLSLDRIVDAGRERIVAGVAEELGRPVAVERIAVGFRRGLAVTLDGIRIGEDPEIGPGDFLTAARVYAVVRLVPLLRGRIEVRRIVVVEPHATVVQTARGTSLDSLGRRRGPADAARPKPGPPAPPQEPGPPAAAPAALIAFVNLEDGALRLVDRRGPEPVETVVAPISVWVSDASLTAPIGFRARATVAGDDPVQVELRGRLGPVGDPPFADDVPLALFLGVTGGPVWIQNLAIEGRARRDADGRPLASVKVRAPSLRAGGVELRAFAADVAEADGILTVDPIGFQALGGTVEVRGRVDHRTAAATFAVAPAVRGLDVAQLVALRDPATAARLRGRLDVEGSVTGSSGDADRVRRTLAGEMRVAVRDGALAGVNVAEQVLDGLTGVGGLATLVPARVRERYPQIFASDDMVFDELRTDLRLAGGRTHVDPVVVSTRDYTAHGAGMVTFRNRLDATATLVASEALTADVLGVFAGAKALTDAGGRLAIPFRLTGVLPDVRARPDRDFVNRALGKALVESGLERLFESFRKPKKRRGGQRRR